MFPSALNTRARRTAHGRWEWWLRWVLLVAAWQGPIPWCHCHDLSSLDADAQADWLAEHIQAAHAGRAVQSGLPQGWHVHVYLPQSSHPDPARPAAAGDCNPSLALRGGNDLTPSLPTASPLVIDGVPIDPRALPTVGDPLERVPGRFFDAYAPSLALPMRFCVSRC